VILPPEMKIKKILLGKDAKSLEDSIVYAKKEIDKLKEFESDSIEYFKEVEARLRKSIQSVETIRFNPFKGTGDGGNQSFSTSFVNENGDGVVISSMYSRDRISIFAKPINKFKSQFETTEEEKQVIERAKKDLN
jgi:hypothetical protein